MLTDREIAQILHKVDSNGDGYVDFVEFLHACEKAKAKAKTPTKAIS